MPGSPLAKLVASATSLALLASCASETSHDAPAEAGAADATREANPDTGHDAPDDSRIDGSVPEDGMHDVTDTQDAADATEASAGWAPYGLLSLNLHCLKLTGTSFTSQQQRFEAIAQAAATENVGAITAQELCSTGGVDALSLLRQALEAATGETWSTAFALAHVAWEGTADEADEGVGLLVRGPLSDVVELDYASQAGLRRVAVIGRLPATLGGFRLASIHLDHVDAEVREAQARETASSLLALADPVRDILVAGDFNAQPGSPALLAMADFGYVELTSALGADRIDHVLAHRASAVVAENAVVMFDGTTYPAVSDHPGMLVRIAPSVGQDVAITRLRADANVAAGEFLSVRGDALPLSWSKGWPAWREPSGTWKLVLTEIASGAPFAYKFLRSDVDWQTGDNASATGGGDHVVVPSF
jgi:endonuclease/exonuclease/phosphatase family metal-dependent hydrolase